MRLLKITDSEISEVDEYFDESDQIEIEQVAPKVVENSPKVDIGSGELHEYDAVFARIPVQNAVFGRVLLEMIEEEGLSLNYSSTAFFSMAKKNYLFHVLKEKDVPAPKTAVVADEKAARNLEEHLKGPLVAKRIEDLREVESSKIDSVEGIQEFAAGVEYDESVLLFSELSTGDKYRCFVAGDKVVSLRDSSEGWKIGEEKLSYSSLPKEQEEMVRRTAKVLGASVAEVLIRDGQVVDVNPNPDLEMYHDISGKNTYQAVADVLKG